MPTPVFIILVLIVIATLINITRWPIASDFTFMSFFFSHASCSPLRVRVRSRLILSENFIQNISNRFVRFIFIIT